MITEKISYKRVRDFGQVFGASFNFTKQNFKAIAGAIIMTLIPFSAIIAFLSIKLQAQTQALGTGFGMDVYKNLAQVFLNNIGIYLVLIIISIITGAVLNTIIFKAIQNNEELDNTSKITTSSILKNFFPEFLMQVINLLLMSIISILAIAIIAFLFGILFAIGNTAISVIAGIILVLFLLAFFFILLPIIFHVSISTLFICHTSKTLIFSAIPQVLKIMKGNFWNTWLVVFVGGIYYTIASTIVSLPTVILAFISSFNRVKFNGETNDDTISIALVIATSISGLLQKFVLGTFYFMIVYQHTSNQEKREASTINDKINSIL